MTTHTTRGPRRWAPLALVALVLLLLAPSGGSHARWSDERTVALPALTMDRVAVAVEPAPPTSPDRSGSVTAEATLRSTAGATPLQWAPRAVAAAPTGPTTPTEAQHLQNTLRVDYRAAESGAECAAQQPAWSWTSAGLATGATRPLSPGASTTLCAEVRSTLPADALVATHGGRRLSLTTTLDATTPVGWAVDPVTWETSYAVDFPQATGLQCRDTLTGIGPAEVSWSWPSVGSTSPAVDRWELLRRDGDRWEAVATLHGDARSIVLRGRDIDDDGWDRRVFKLRAYPFPGSDYYAESTQQVEIGRKVLGGPWCVTVGSNAAGDQVVLP